MGRASRPHIVTTAPPIGIVTGEVAPRLTDDDRAVAASLQERGFRPEPVVWTDDAVDWTEYDVVLFRSCWDYHGDPDAFRDVLDTLESARAGRERLGIDVIDLLYVHWPMRAYDPADTLAAFDDLRETGVIRHVGLSNFTPELLEEALSHLESPLFAHQVECHPMLPQRTLRSMAREFDHHLVAYSPLAKGAVASVPELRTIADETGTTAPQVALAWLLAKGVSAIPKSSMEVHIRENLEARRLSLTPGQVDRIDDIDERDRTVDFEGAPWNG